MVPLVALLASVPTPLDQGELDRRLVAEAKRLLAAFEVPGPYDAKFVGPVVSSDGTSTMTSCAISTGDGRRYEAYLRNASGRLFALEYRKPGDYGGATPDRAPGSRSPEAQRARAAAILARVAPPLPRLAMEDEYPAFAWRYATDRFFFPLAIRERRSLVPSLGYGLTLDAKTGEVVRYSAAEDVPPLDEAPVRLARADAVAAVRRMLVDDAPQPYVNRVMKPWTSYTVDPDATSSSKAVEAPVRLGWFVPEGGSAARLAWKVPYWVYHHATGDTKGALLAIMVDANTGERLPSRSLSGSL